MLPIPAPESLARIEGSQFFGDQIREARRLGFELHVAPEFMDGVAAARLVPQTRKARAVCRSSGVEGANMIEATAQYDEPRDRIDACRAAAAEALTLAKDAGA